jgi:hypothetical protein
MRWQIEPMAAWPYPETKPRKRSAFGASWSATLDLLDRELQHLNVSGAVAIRVVGSPSDVRLDGMLRASARLPHPGVAVSFHSRRHGALSYPCDTFCAGGGPLVDWQANVRAIALGLEALRKVERYGIASRGEQYAGWRAIESGTKSAFANKDEALVWLRAFGHWPFGEQVDLGRLLRRAANLAHPDKNAGDRTAWDRYDAARQLLGGT